MVKVRLRKEIEVMIQNGAFANKRILALFLNMIMEKPHQIFYLNVQV